VEGWGQQKADIAIDNRRSYRPGRVEGDQKEGRLYLLMPVQ
jgi:hypothetical protein